MNEQEKAAAALAVAELVKSKTGDKPAQSFEVLSIAVSLLLGSKFRLRVDA